MDLFVNHFNIFAVQKYFLQLQADICQQLSTEDGVGIFHEDHWTRKEGNDERNSEGGGGCTRILKNGHFLEQAGVNFSHVFGTALPPAATKQRPELSGSSFEALGVSVVIHPHNPYAPTTHANLRFFTAQKPNHPPLWWFGGGFDLTPYYPFEEDCIHWHQTAKRACHPFGAQIYPKFKQCCDDYFYLKHRNEARGIGGLFFDDLNADSFLWSFETCFDFVQSIGDHFMQAYMPILARRKKTPYGKRERDFQLYRRGRYVEFNLIQDRGTLFGLQSNGRTESILMSLPPLVRWDYDWHPEPGSPEEKLYTEFLPPRNWCEEKSVLEEKCILKDKQAL